MDTYSPPLASSGDQDKRGNMRKWVSNTDAKLNEKIIVAGKANRKGTTL